MLNLDQANHLCEMTSVACLVYELCEFIHNS